MSYYQEEAVKTFIKITNYKQANEKREYFAFVENRKVPITKDIYDCYTQDLRRERYVRSRDAQHNLVSYHAQDETHELGENITGEEMLIDPNYEPFDQRLIHDDFLKKLPKAMEELKEEEKVLVQLLYGERMTEREAAENLGIPERTINDIKHRLLAKLHKLIKK